MTSKSEPPAPPPCEAPTLSDAAWDAIDSVLSDEERETFRAWLAQKDAEIAELRAAIQDYIDSPVHGDHKGIYNPDDCCAPSARVRAALAPKEGK